MAVYKEEKTNTWRAVYRYTDWNGERKQTQKRGFKTKREAQAWEREQLNKTSADLDMTFKSFVDLYTADMKTRLKENTWATKDHIIRTTLERTSLPERPKSASLSWLHRSLTILVPGRTYGATRPIRGQFSTWHWRMTRAVYSAGCSACLEWRGQAPSTSPPTLR